MARTNAATVSPSMNGLWARLHAAEAFRPVYARGDGAPTFNMFIGGRWQAGKHLLPVTNPVDNSTIAQVPEAGEAGAAAAVSAADAATRAIRDMPGTQRIDVLEKAAQLILEHRAVFEEALLLEAGKPRHDQHGEVSATSQRLRAAHLEATKIQGEYLPGDWAPDTVGKMALVIREPLGIVACIGPFNYPLFIPTAKITPALLAGNTVAAKASHQTPISLLLLARVLELAGLPAGALNVITGSGATSGEALVTDPRVRMVSFTGSTNVGKRIHSIAGLKRFHLELGGKGHALVFDDADVPVAAAKCVEGAFKNAGQRCDAVSVAIVDRKVAAEFVAECAKSAKAWVAGDPRDEATKVGPLITTEAVKRVEALIDEAVKQGAKVVAGGKRRGQFIEPTILGSVTPTMRIATEETFGPVLPIMEAGSTDEAIDLATKTPYGLDSCVFTKSFPRMWRAAKRLSCGEVTINDLPKHGVGHFPFGGQRESGVGREGIGYSIEEMTELKTIVFTLGPKPGQATP
ncbi:MAG: aldehyde dehydrogenase family protein [Euryarchaeota archaeon]|nr:aldehyde dehydrogenase family protein [Euryarchaeota archaeon]